MGPPKGLAQSEFIGVCQIRSTWVVSIISPSSELGIESCFFFLDSLLIDEVSEKNLRIFSNRIDQLETGSTSSIDFN